MLSFAVVISADDDDDDIDDIVVDMAVDVKPIFYAILLYLVQSKVIDIFNLNAKLWNSIYLPSNLKVFILVSKGCKASMGINSKLVFLENNSSGKAVKLQLAKVSCCRERNLWNILGVIVPEKLLLDKCSILKLATSSFCISPGLRKFALNSSSLRLDNWSPVEWLAMKSCLERLEIYLRALSVDCPKSRSQRIENPRTVVYYLFHTIFEIDKVIENRVRLPSTGKTNKVHACIVYMNSQLNGEQQQTFQLRNNIRYYLLQASNILSALKGEQNEFINSSPFSKSSKSKGFEDGPAISRSIPSYVGKFLLPSSSLPLADTPCKEQLYEMRDDGHF
uniref:Uncharacterized protein n=1 Tax=Glossina pallidipes TaxID=7398 RepID=A0A1A9ZE44_GLOPL